MPKQRRNFSGAEKMAVLREHLIEGVSISEVCDKHGFPPTMFYQRSRHAGIRGRGGSVRVPMGIGRAKSRQQAAEPRKIEALEAKVADKNEVLAELMSEHVALKKFFARSEGSVGSP